MLLRVKPQKKRDKLIRESNQRAAAVLIAAPALTEAASQTEHPIDFRKTNTLGERKRAMVEKVEAGVDHRLGITKGPASILLIEEVMKRTRQMRKKGWRLAHGEDAPLPEEPRLRVRVLP